MAITVEDLYRQYAGREPDPSGLEFWTKGFLGQGDTIIDANEEASFARAVAEARAQGTEPAATTTSTVDLAQSLLQENRNTGSSTVTPPPTTKLVGGPVQMPPVSTVTNADILGWFNANPNADATLVNQTMQAAGVSPSQVSSALASNPDVAKTYLTQQILGQGTTEKWTGEGKGSAQANAADMANILAGIGITDINQFGQITKQVPVTYSDEYGTLYDTGQTQTVTTYGNKVTGQEVPSTYGERQTGNAFGGTFAGKGNTGYRVEFAPNGTPVFYTTGASSSDAANWMPIVQLALAATGAGGLLGGSLLGAGASQIASNALGNAILGGVTTGIAGGDPLKGALLGGAGGALSGYLQGGTLDATGITERQFAIADATQLAEQGLSSSQIRDALISGGYNDAIIDRALNAISPTTPAAVSNPIVDSNTVSITGTANPSLNNLIGTLAQVPTISVNATRPREQVSTDAINAVNTLLSGGNVTTPTVEVTAEGTKKTDVPAITSITTPVVTTPTTPTVTTPTGVTKTDNSLTTSDVIKLLGIGTTIAGINAAVNPTTTTPTTYPIVEVPTDWRTPPKTGVAPFTPLPPINFGDRNLLIGTQWEKFLDPNYGQVPEPIQYSQPSSMSYNDLMGILGSKQGYPAKSSLSINDIISGIQNQYGQARTGAMG
jgi:hypothetical protein